MKVINSLSVLKFFALAAVLGVSCSAQAQSSARQQQKITPTTADDGAAQDAVVIYRHLKPVKTATGSATKIRDFAPRRESARGKASRPSSPGSGGDLRFLGDLSYLGGAVVELAESHAIYLLPNGNCPVATCWGDPETFLADLARSDLIHVTDQYAGQFSGNRYTLGSSSQISYTPPVKPLTDGNILAVVHAVAAASGETGYGHIYHVFLPPGQDECFTATDGICYSPDNDATFVFCAYHSSVDFRDIGHVLYSVEPFQNVAGCNVKPGTPNGQLVDSTNSTLSHELIETITDPDGDAWFNFSSEALAGAEIADECVFFVFIPPSTVFSDPSPFKVRGHRYAVQPEYSNITHACTIAED